MFREIKGKTKMDLFNLICFRSALEKGQTGPKLMTLAITNQIIFSVFVEKFALSPPSACQKLVL